MESSSASAQPQRSSSSAAAVAASSESVSNPARRTAAITAMPQHSTTMTSHAVAAAPQTTMHTAASSSALRRPDGAPRHVFETELHRHHHDDEDWFEDNIGRPSRDALHKFFYPPLRDPEPSSPSPGTTRRVMDVAGDPPLGPPLALPNDGGLAPAPPIPTPPPHEEFDEHFAAQHADDLAFVEKWWTTYDDIIILAILTQIGICFRLAVSTWFAFFDSVFRNDSALFVNLPLNCLSCFFLGMLCSGERCMEIIATRFTPPRTQQDLHRDLDDDENDNDDDDDDDAQDGLMHGTSHNKSPHSNSDTFSPSSFDHVGTLNGDARHDARVLRRRRHLWKKHRRPKRQHYFHHWEPPTHLNDDLRDVQLLALERRIRQSKCLLLFPVRKQDVDVMEHYFNDGYKKKESRRHQRDIDEPVHNDEDMEAYGGGGLDVSFDLALDEEDGLEPEQQESARERAIRMQRPMRRLEASDFSDRRDKTETATAARTAAVNRAASPPRRRHIGETSVMATEMADDEGLLDVRLASKAPSYDGTCREIKAASAVVTPSPPPPPCHIEGTQPATGPPAPPPPGNGGGDETQQLDYYHESLNQIVQDVQVNVTENWSRLQRVNLADGWDLGTTPEAMSDDLILGLRDGFCGALSSFSSWNSAMVNLLKSGDFTEAFVGYMIGLQLPIVAYRFGQHVTVYWFIWRCRRESKRDERRGGYGIRVAMNEQSDRDDSDHPEEDGLHEVNVSNGGLVDGTDPDGDPDAMGNGSPRPSLPPHPTTREYPSVRAVATAIFIMALVTQFTSLSFFTDPEQRELALSLLFSPLGVLARWRLSKFNTWRPTFPLGTFTANMLACALSGGLGTLLAGNPGPRESIVLQSFINGFGGTLSSLANFVVEILAGVDPVLLRFDGITYAVLSIMWAMVIGFIFSTSVDWADQTGTDAPS